MIDANPFANHGGFADDNSGAVVDKKTFVDVSPGVDVDTGQVVGVFGHHPGQQRNFEMVEMMGHAVDRDGKEAGIAENNLVNTFGGGVALDSGTDVGCQDAAQSRQLLDKIGSRIKTALLTVQAIVMIAQAVMANRQDNLVTEHLMEDGKLLTEIVFKVDRVDSGLREVAGKEDVASLFDDSDSFIAQGNRLWRQMLKTFAAETSFGQLVDNFVQILSPLVKV